MIESAWSVPVVILLSYLLGSVPTSIVAGRLAKGIDVREHGSGNAGGTNAFRVLGPRIGVIVIAGDIGKAVIATLLVSRLGWTEIMGYEAFALIAGMSAIVGHIWTVFARFRGGKGVAAAGGMLLALYPAAFLGALACFALVIMITGIVSAGSISAALAFPVLIWMFDATGLVDYPTLLKIVCIPVGLLIVFTHRSNIGRLLTGTENRFPKLMLLRSKAAKRRAEKARGGNTTPDSEEPAEG